MHPEPLGLRERKRRATRRAIQLAALQLVDERGADAVTVEDIAERADISPRTFFNYFGTKEGPIIGDLPSLPDDAVVTDVLERGPLWDGIRDLLIAATEQSVSDIELMQLRRSVLARYPHYFALRMGAMHEVEETFTAQLEQRFRADGLDDEQAHSRAALCTLLALGAVRHAWKVWAEHEGAEPLVEHITASFASAPSIVVQQHAS
ncbi:TetR/AcrR family transcriptional regulator [Arenivirga flava]|uniref:TetR family transcriptional regulator n=1 Tax=Arenivirga flava TaxID=1930060 RepID=A0AA37XC90_9MICO|nr:TetR/AcrR family transcriptional regulator [Arenivirga flava]GMA29776.1 TetR family transcriptional regulator [Arenivirga flava]